MSLRLGRPALWSLIAAASLAFHLRGITAPPYDYHYHRQANTAAIARNYHRDGMHFFTPQIDWDGPNQGQAATEFPLYMWLVGLFWPLWGLRDAWGHILSSLFSAGAAIYLFEFLRDDLGEERKAEALCAALVFCALPLEIYFGRTIQPEALALLATIAAIFHWNRFLKPGRSWAHWAAAVVFAFLAVAHKLPYGYFLIPLAALAFLKLGKAAWRDARVWAAPALCLGGVFAWYRYASAGTYVVPTNQLGSIEHILNYQYLPHYVWFQFISRFPELSATYAGLVLGALGARELVARRGKTFFGWWFASVCLYIVVGGGYTFYHEYTSLPFALINAAFIGVGAVGLARKAPALAAILLLAIPVHAELRINHWYRTSYPFLDKAEAAAARVGTRDDLFVCNERASSLYLYFLDRRGWSWGWTEEGEQRSEQDLQADIAKGARFYATAKDQAPAFVSARYPAVYDDGAFVIYRLEPAAVAAKGSRSARP